MKRPLVSDAEVRLQSRYALTRAARACASHSSRFGWPGDPAGYQSAALFGVALAVRAFKPERGAAFSTYAYAAVGRMLSREANWQAYGVQHIRPGRELHPPPLSLDVLMCEGDADRRFDRVPDPAPGPEQQVLDWEDAREAAEAVAQLPPGEREAVLLRAWDGATLREVEGATGVCKETVRKRYVRGVAAARSRVEQG